VPGTKILEIGAMIVDDGVVVDQLQWMLNHNIEIPEKITEITGITKAIIDKDGGDPQVALKEFVQLLNTADQNMTHNGYRFDIPFLIRAVQEDCEFTLLQASSLGVYLTATMIDTAVICKARKMNIVPQPGDTRASFAKRVMDIRAKGVKYNVTFMCEELGIDLTGVELHRALADVIMTYKIYQKLNIQK
jgi:DNA polymerase III epsilon subunit-like protein